MTDDEMAHDEVFQLRARVAWLEREMGRLLWTLISLSSAGLGWLAATIIFPDSKGLSWFLVFVGVWLGLGFIVQRSEFKGAPEHIQFLG